MPEKDPRQAPGEAASIGFIVRRDGRYIVHCATCGKGMGSPKVPPGAKVAKDKLRGIGWSDAVDGLWRCPDHAPGLPQREGVC